MFGSYRDRNTRQCCQPSQNYRDPHRACWARPINSRLKGDTVISRGFWDKCPFFNFTTCIVPEDNMRHCKFIKIQPPKCTECTTFNMIFQSSGRMPPDPIIRALHFRCSSCSRNFFFQVGNTDNSKIHNICCPQVSIKYLPIYV